LHAVGNFHEQQGIHSAFFEYCAILDYSFFPPPPSNDLIFAEFGLTVNSF
jgi:hypothetical protein